MAFATTGATRVIPALPQARAVIYEQIGAWLRANTPPAASVGMYEVGTVGYYADRRVIDFYGLIQPDVPEHLADPSWAPQHYQPDYVVIHPDWYTACSAPGSPRTTSRCRRSPTPAASARPMVLYARK